MKTTLIAVVNGDQYEKWAEDLFSSADHYFRPTSEVEFLMLPGRPGWPDATMRRPTVLLERFPDSDYVFLCDADMLFVGWVGPNILPRKPGLVATQHPGYVETPSELLPFERRRESACFVDFDAGHDYYCGGFWGGSHDWVWRLCSSIDILIDVDEAQGITPIWHDESALNKVLTVTPPETTLTPSYCHPDNDSYYKTIWKVEYDRKLVAIDKTPAQRVGR